MDGTIVWETLGSVVLKGNPLGDPRLREVPVYLPPSYKTDHKKRYPVVFYLPGFTGTPKGVYYTHPWKENLFDRLDRLIAEGRTSEMILVVPDCFTRYGGSQYRNSEGTGRYEDHIVSELVGYVDSKYRTLAGPECRAVLGKSSGGYGALWLGMGHPDVFGHALCHCGDMHFEACYIPDMLKAAAALDKYGGSFKRFVGEFELARDKSSFPHALINMAGMASCYSPNPRSPMGFDLPFDERTGELKPAVFKRWLDCDPVRLAPKMAKNLRKLRTLWFDCGTKDEFYLQLGARKLSSVLKKLRVRHVYEEHEHGHFDMNPRYDASLTLLGKAFPKK